MRWRPQGLKSLFPLDATAVMGLNEILLRIPTILARVRQAADFAVEARPDVVVLIDSPDFTHRIARRIKAVAPRIATINYVAPQVWASRSWRARAMANYFDMVLALLPFEAPVFEKVGLHAVFVGHPAIERAQRMTGGEAFRARHAIAPEAPLLAVAAGQPDGRNPLHPAHLPRRGRLAGQARAGPDVRAADRASCRRARAAGPGTGLRRSTSLKARTRNSPPSTRPTRRWRPRAR